jgi:predicted ribosome quality control (RQC) complex YloA/Tae2 family protein
MLSLLELSRVARILDRDLAGSRVERWIQPDGLRLAISLYGRPGDPEKGRSGDPEGDAGGGEARTRQLLLCAGEEVGRVGELPRAPRAAPELPAFAAYLRAHLPRARLVRAGILDGDRQLAIRFEAREGDFDLLLSLLGRRSNLYLLDSERRLVAALRPLSATRPELSVGREFESPQRSLPTEGEDRWADCPDAQYLARIEDHYAGTEFERDVEQLGRSLLKVLRRERKGAERRLERVESELAEADRASELQRQGDLLKSALGDVPPGASEVSVRDFGSGEDILIPLDPSLSPKQNLEAIFKRYRKFIRRLAKAGGQLDAALARRDEVEALELRCRALAEQGDVEDAAAGLREIAAQPEVARLLERSASRPAAREPLDKPSVPPKPLRNVPRKLWPRRFRSADGLEIWVGRSDEGNDYLSTRLARGNDLFFHVDGSPGSHVVLRTEGRLDAPSESLLEACELAVRFSKQRNAARVDLHVVPIKNVRKPKGAKRGLVHVTGGKTVHLRREEQRLERVLANRIEE